MSVVTTPYLQQPWRRGDPPPPAFHGRDSMIRWLASIGLAVTTILSSHTRGESPLPPTKAPSDAVPQLLETVDLLASVQLYQTYLNIGFLADGRAEGTYEDDDAKRILG